MEGMKVKPGYEDVVKDLVNQLAKLKEEYKDDTGGPVKFWPVRAYN